MNRDELPESKDFAIRIVESAKVLELDCYGVYHKDTDVLNHRDTSITRAYEALGKMQTQFDIMAIDVEKNRKALEARKRNNVVKMT